MGTKRVKRGEKTRKYDGIRSENSLAHAAGVNLAVLLHGKRLSVHLKNLILNGFTIFSRSFAPKSESKNVNAFKICLLDSQSNKCIPNVLFINSIIIIAKIFCRLFKMPG